MASSSSSSSFSNSNSFSSDNEGFYDMDQKVTMLFHAGFIACTFGNLFTTTKMEVGRAFCGPNYQCLKCANHIIHLNNIKKT
jgi:hypothetical protein